MNKNIGDMTKEELYELCNELLDKDTDYMLIQRRIDKAIEKLEKLILYDEYITIHTDFIYDLKNILGDKENEIN